MKVTLQVNGREMSFSEQELTAIVEEYLSKRITIKEPTFKVAQKPSEREWFEVKPLTIDQKLFEKKRDDSKQEKTRKLILEAFDEMKKNPEKYGRNFKTIIPNKTWSNSRTMPPLYTIVSRFGDHMADWVEQGLEWAQRIANGESWEDICNNRDTAIWYRVIKWKNKDYAQVGGGGNTCINYPPTNISEIFKVIPSYDEAVPLIVGYDEYEQTTT